MIPQININLYSSLSQVAASGIIRSDNSMSNLQNIIHASDSVENAAIEVRRFFRPEEVFDYTAHSQYTFKISSFLGFNIIFMFI